MALAPTGEELRAWREQAGLTRREAALATNVALRTLARLETGRLRAHSDLAEWLRHVYRVAALRPWDNRSRGDRPKWSA